MAVACFRKFDNLIRYRLLDVVVAVSDPKGDEPVRRRNLECAPFPHRIVRRPASPLAGSAIGLSATNAYALRPTPRTFEPRWPA